MAAAVITWKEAWARESGDGGGGDDGREVRFSCGDGREVPKDGQGMRRWRQRTWFWPMALAAAVTAAGKRELAIKTAAYLNRPSYSPSMLQLE